MQPFRTLTPAICLVAVFLSPAALGQSCVSVTTYHNDNSRTAQNLSETVLTPATVGNAKLLFGTKQTLDSWSISQPLYLPDTPISGGMHNVVFVTTLANSVYAFDGDTGVQYWHVVYGPPDTAPFQESGGCTDSGFGMSPSEGAGIVGTPVIDTSISPPAMYFVTKEFDGTTHTLQLHAVDTSSGNELSPPVILQGSVTNNSGEVIQFAAEYQMARPAMLLSNGIIYVALGSVGCREVPNYGWMMSYTFSPAAGFTQQAVFNTTPDLANPSGEGPFGNGGIWQAGAGPAADSSGNVYFETADGNNYFEDPKGWEGLDFGDSIVKLTSSLGAPSSSASFFTPYDDRALYAGDLDLGSTGPVLLPEQPGAYPDVLVGYDKSEEVYVVNRDNMGGYTGPTGPNNILQDVVDPTTGGCPTGNVTFTKCTSLKGTCGWNEPTYWNNNLYFSSNPGPLMSYTWTPGAAAPLAACPTIEGGYAAHTYTATGSPSISANGTSGGLLWVITWPPSRIATLRAFDATNLASQLFATPAGNIPSYPSPTIANGIVYVAAKGRLYAYGLIGQSGCKIPHKATEAKATSPSQ